MKAYEPELGKPFISPRAHDRSPFHATREDPLLLEHSPAFSVPEVSTNPDYPPMNTVTEETSSPESPAKSPP